MTPATHHSRKLLLAALGLALAAGCRSKDGSAAGGMAKHDPLIGGSRIPPQNVPLPDRGVGAKGGRPDPLKESLTGRDKDKQAKADNADRWKGPYIPDANSTTASLASAARLRATTSDLTIDGDEGATRAGGVLLQPPDGGIRPTAGTTRPPAADAIPPDVLRELQTLGVKAGDYEVARTSDGGSAVRARVLLGSNGATRQYEEVGPTAAAAARKVAEQIRADRP